MRGGVGFFTISIVFRRGVIGFAVGLVFFLVVAGCGGSSGGSAASRAATKVVTQAPGSGGGDQTLASTTTTPTTTPAPATPATTAAPATTPAPTTATTARPHATPVTPATTAAVPATSSTTAAPATTTTTKPVTFVSVPWATVSITNEFGSPVDVSLNGVHYQLTAGQTLLQKHVTPAASGNDVIQVTDVNRPSCGVGNAQAYFVANLWYQLNVVKGSSICLGAPGPDFTLQQALAMTG